MTNKQLKLSAVMLKVFYLADIIEAEITALNPISNVKDTELVLNLESLKKQATKYRKLYDSIDTDSREIIGEISDMIDNQIIKLINNEL